jgi:hypothetical protein
MDRKAWNIFIFTVGVLMLLLRPYMIYQLTKQSNLRNDPVNVYNLLQRLVKKKDEHHETAEVADLQSRQSKTTFRLPVSWVHILRSFIDPIVALLSLSGILATMSVLLRARPDNHRYRLISCFQI